MSERSGGGVGGGGGSAAVPRPGGLGGRARLVVQHHVDGKAADAVEGGVVCGRRRGRAHAQVNRAPIAPARRQRQHHRQAAATTTKGRARAPRSGNTRSRHVSATSSSCTSSDTLSCDASASLTNSSLCVCAFRCACGRHRVAGVSCRQAAPPGGATGRRAALWRLTGGVLLAHAPARSAAPPSRAAASTARTPRPPRCTHAAPPRGAPRPALRAAQHRPAPRHPSRDSWRRRPRGGCARSTLAAAGHGS